MNEIILLDKVKKEIESVTLFEIDRLSLKEGEIVGIVGANGSGKSTLLNLITGQDTSFSGVIKHKLDSKQLHYVKQEVENFEESWEHVGPSLLLNKEWENKKGFMNLSGGEKLKKRLKEGINKGKPILVLDEPTNHLDELSVEQLIKELKKYQGSIIVVSHDRYFLDEITTVIWSIEEQKIKNYPGNYSKFVELRKEERETQQRLYDKQQKEIKKVHKKVQQLSHWSDSAHAQSTKKEGAKEYYRLKAKKMDSQKKSVTKRLEGELEKKRIEKVREEDRIHFRMEVSKKKHGTLFLAENLRKYYEHILLFKNGNFTINFGEKLAITGGNGSGKTTLLKILLGIENHAGKLWQSDFAEIGYLSQEVFDLPLEQTIEEFLDIEEETKSRTLTIMIQLGFSVKQWKEEIGKLSMGERVKLKLMSHMLNQKNVLILDEPTNHLDIPSREELENVLLEYEGTIIFVSHDRYFREKVANREIEIKDQQIINAKEENLPKKQEEKWLLEFKRDELLAKLSILSPGNKEYEAANQQFDDILKQLRNMN